MNDECKKLGLNPPVVSIEGNVVKVSFSIKQWGVNNSAASTLEMMLDSSVEGLSSSVRMKMLAILDNINSKPGIKSLGLSDATGIPKKTVDRYLLELKKANIIRYEGAAKNGGYHIDNTFSKSKDIS